MKCLSFMSLCVLVCTNKFKVQDDEVGDGTMLVVVLAFTRSGKVKNILPMTIIEGIVCINFKPFTFRSLYLNSFLYVMTMPMNAGWDIILTLTFAYIKSDA